MIVARIPIGRPRQAEDIARGLVCLAAGEADSITGSTLSIDGGRRAKPSDAGAAA